MARMSIESRMRSDARVLRLANLCGWSRRETFACLIDVWAVCYDQVSEVLQEEEVDAAAELVGFTKHLITARLAKHVKRGVLIAGAKKRIKYLRDAKRSGREGGIKSGESRRNSSKRPLKGPLPDPSSNLNPTVTPTVPDPDISPVPDPEKDPSLCVGGDHETLEYGVRAPAPHTQREASPIPDGWGPEPTAENTHASLEALRIGVVVELELEKFRAWARAGDVTAREWNAKWRWWLQQAFPTPIAIRDAMTKREREKTSKAARDRERAEEEKRKQCADTDRAENRRIAKAALENNYRLPTEKATG